MRGHRLKVFVGSFYPQDYTIQTTLYHVDFSLTRRMPYTITTEDIKGLHERGRKNKLLRRCDGSLTARIMESRENSDDDNQEGKIRDDRYDWQNWEDHPDSEG